MEQFLSTSNQKIKEIVVYYKVKQFTSLILHDTDVTIYGDFCGSLHTNAGNITIVGQVNSNSKISSNRGSIKIHSPSFNPREVVLSNSYVMAFSPEVKIEITGQVLDSPIQADSGTITIHQKRDQEVPSSLLTQFASFSKIFKSTHIRKI
ncbi:MAG: hypothetical protein ACTJLM_04555 [Ehrlichia sp.]